MTALTSPRRATFTRAASGPTFLRSLRSELLKLTTVRSTWWALGIGAALTVAIAFLYMSAAEGGNPIFGVLVSAQFTMLVAGVLGAIAVTGEYATGMIRSTMTATPRRGQAALAKAVAIALVVGAATVLTYLIGLAVTIPTASTAVVWSDPAQSLLPLVLGVCAMVVYALIGTGFGLIVRNGAGAIAATVGVLFVAPIAVGLFQLGGESWQWLVDLGRYLPVSAGSTLTAIPTADILVPALTLVAWVVGLVGIGTVLLQRRDA
ncbi:ABC transporter permease subunit [Microbacterium sp. 5K110]|jgi:ABC-2 type transport system permease protein|uniref:ABC transporter permease subunit n=1 Tax=unclassified Microbacterium TaxID=2609290 RepID=UPI0010FED2C7|nr:ABC transporter permease subunit [Microbacterium sp. 5K110]TLF34449.1 ABC transporter permease [Microbacterium sp. 5K110]